MTPRSLVVAAIALLCAAFAGAQAPPRPEYGIKQDQPRTGSSIRHYQVLPTALPVNLPYEQLSPEDRATFHLNYEAIAPGDEPPFPMGGLKTILDPLRKAQAKLLVQGDLFLVAKIDPDGVVQQITAYRSPSPEMTRFAGQMLLLTKFKPAVCSGQPCTMEFPLRFKFTVR